MTSDIEDRAGRDSSAALDARIGAHPELLLLSPRWNPETGLMQFTVGDHVHVTARATLIGGWELSGHWRWGWLVEELPSAANTASARLKTLAKRTGRAEFLATDAFPATSVEARALVAEACEHLQAAGACNLASEDAVWWFALHDIEHIEPLESLTERAKELAERVLGEGLSVQILNDLRRRFPSLQLQLMGRDLRGQREPWAFDLHAQILMDGGQLQTHQVRSFGGADLSRSRFDEAILRGLVLRNATFERASLVGADLSRADLRGVSFKGAFLNGTNFNRAVLSGADFTDAELAGTLLTDVDLSEVQGLDTVHHMAPSEISLSTLTASRFKVSPTFLRRAGVSRGLIDDLANGQRFARQYETCFLSYSSKDATFAETLYGSLQNAGVRVFWDRFDVLPGESLREQLVEAIRQHDRLIVVLSDHGMASDWVRQEIELAWYHKRESLIPIRLCAIEKVQAWTASHPTLPDLAGHFPILDFSAWRTRKDYARTVKLLLRSLAGGADIVAADDQPEA